MRFVGMVVAVQVVVGVELWESGGMMRGRDG